MKNPGDLHLSPQGPVSPIFQEGQDPGVIQLKSWRVLEGLGGLGFRGLDLTSAGYLACTTEDLSFESAYPFGFSKLCSFDAAVDWKKNLDTLEPDQC